MVSKVTTLALKTIQFFISRGKKATAIVYVKQLYIYFKVNNLQSLSIKLTGETILSTVVLQKSAHWWSTLQVCQRGWWAIFRVVPHLNTKECPCHVYSDSMPSKQKTGQAIICNGTTNGFKVQS